VFVLNKLGRLSIAALVVTGVALPAAPVAAAKTICVGLVVDARPAGGPMSAKCTTVPDGSTGYDVLRAGGHTVGFRNDGIICTIDNRPSQGCGTTDATHYWAYFHREPGSTSWSYSNEGATTYKPGNSETEGWVWRNGDMAKPQNVPYSTICPQTASPTPRPTVTHEQHVRATPTATSAPIPAPRHSSAVQPSASPHKRKPHPARTIRTVAPTSSATSSPPVSIAAVNRSKSDRSGAPWGLIVGLLAVVGLGGAAALQWRRRGAD
jgi:hypothetical protein